ncbi:hypothetical protein CEXT_725391 [Caerostris extrusa]|uniref:Uncharacterized protein n=1 Tax=Caerostris extrusa TaxID=172846 RepID=A0AAV4XLP7_CAEEX|nr:hypothetical protein CEXT_725391 [Caerostris extrusa]
MPNLHVPRQKMSNLPVPRQKMSNLPVTRQKRVDVESFLLQDKKKTEDVQSFCSIYRKRQMMFNLSVPFTEKEYVHSIIRQKMSNLSITRQKISNLSITRQNLSITRQKDKKK